MAFAGANSQIHLSDGRTIFAKETRDQLAERMARVSLRWPLVEITEAEGTRRWVAGTHIVEIVSLEREGS